MREESPAVFGRFMAQLFVGAIDRNHDRGSATVVNGAFVIHWRYGEHRLGDSCKDHVLTITHCEITRGYNRPRCLYWFILHFLQSNPAPRIPIAFLHFESPAEELIRALRNHHFNPYRIGDRLDFWHQVTGQKELL
jgi:hypothetical protein